MTEPLEYPYSQRDQQAVEAAPEPEPEGEPEGARRGVAIVVARFNGEITSKLLESALEELERAGVGRDAITVVPVPGAFELPLASMAFAKTRRYACVVA